MALASQTVSYTTIATLALDKLSDKIADAISTSCAAFYMYKKKGNWEGTKSGGRQLRKPVMYQLQTIRPLGSYGTVNVNPIDSHTSVYFDWVQAAVPVSFSDMEEFQTGGEESIETIVKAKYQQAKASLDDFFSRSLLQGQASIDGATVTTPVTSPLDGSYFIEPLFKLASYSPSSSLTVGGVDQSTNSWWQNQAKACTGTTLSAFLASLRTLHVLCQRGGGGSGKAPDFHLTDERTYNVYEKALSVFHQNSSYAKADIPFDNVLFKGAPVIADELMPDVYFGGAGAIFPINASTGDGTWFMGNSNVMGFTYDSAKSFKMGPNVRPNNQLVTSALMPVRGAHWVNNRRKLGVGYGIVLETLEAATS
jgi:hypothetical protein